MSNPAEVYENYIVPALFEPWARYLVELANPQPGDRVLDVACGTGIAARRAAPLVSPGGNVAGLDPNPNMLTVAQNAGSREGASIDWHEGRAESLPFPSDSFDLVLSQQGVQFFSDRQAGIDEMARVLAPVGASQSPPGVRSTNTTSSAHFTRPRSATLGRPPRPRRSRSTMPPSCARC